MDSSAVALDTPESLDTPAVLPASSITSMTLAPSKASGKVMNRGIPEDPRKWSPQNLKDFLETKKEEFFLDDEDIIRLYEERVSGRVLLLLAKEELITSYGLPRGTAGSIELLINALKQPQAVVKATGESASQSGPSTKSPDAWNRLREFEERLNRQVFQIIVKPNTSSSTPWLVNINTVTLADLATFITQHHHKVKDTDRFIFEKNGVKIAEPQTDAELRDFLQTMTAKKDTTLIVDPKSDVKVFSESNMEEVCTLYGISYDPRNPLSQFPVFQCEYNHIDEELLSYLMNELNSRTALTPADQGPEAHKSIYIYCILHAIAKSFNSQFLVLAERYVEGSKAKGNVDYSIELRDGEILGVTELKKENYIQGVAQNAMEIRSAWEYNRKRKVGEISEKSRCFGIATDADNWYFLEYTPGHTPKISKKYQVMFQGEFQKEHVKQISGIINWLLKEGLEQPMASEPASKKAKTDK